MVLPLTSLKASAIKYFRNVTHHAHCLSIDLDNDAALWPAENARALAQVWNVRSYESTDLVCLNNACIPNNEQDLF